MNSKDIFLGSLGSMVFILHCRLSSIALYLLLPTVVWLVGFKYRVAGYVSLIVIVALWRFYYLAFVDKRRKIYADGYQPNIEDRTCYCLLAVLFTGILLIVLLGQLLAPELMRCGFH